MHHPISKQTKAELLAALRARYQRAPKADKTKVLDEFVAVAGCHRKHAIRLLTASRPAAPSTPVVARRIYGEAVCEALVVLWEAADRILDRVGDSDEDHAEVQQRRHQSQDRCLLPSVKAPR